MLLLLVGKDLHVHGHQNGPGLFEVLLELSSFMRQPSCFLLGCLYFFLAAQEELLALVPFGGQFDNCPLLSLFLLTKLCSEFLLPRPGSALGFLELLLQFPSVGPPVENLANKTIQSILTVLYHPICLIVATSTTRRISLLAIRRYLRSSPSQRPWPRRPCA